MNREKVKTLMCCKEKRKACQSNQQTLSSHTLAIRKAVIIPDKRMKNRCKILNKTAKYN